MPTTPYAVAQISVNGGAPQQGGLTVAGASTIQLSLTNTSLLTSVRWEIYAYPVGWPTPSGWTLDASTGIIYSTDTTPALITLEAAATRWGKWLVRCIGNGGTKNGVPPTTDPVTGSYLPNDVIDIASGWSVVSPNIGIEDVALFEGTQFGGLLRWMKALRAAFHLIDTFAGTVSGSVIHDAAMHDANYTTTETSGDIYVGSDIAFTIDRTLTLKSTAAVGTRVTWYDSATTAGGSLASHNLIIADGGAANIQYGTTTAATYTAKLADWPPGSRITLVKVTASLWKVLA